MIDDTTQQKVYDKLRSFDGMELAGHEPVSASIASALSEGEVLADTGEQYESIQDAVDASEGWTFVGPGKFYENVTIYTDDFTLKGAGYDTLIDGGNVGNAISAPSSNVNILNIRVTTGSPSSYNGVYSMGSGTVTKNVYVSGTGSAGLELRGSNTVVMNCTINDTNSVGILTGGVNTIINGCSFDNNASSAGIFLSAGDQICSNCVVSNSAGNDGIQANDNDQIIIGNRIINSPIYGIDIDSSATDCIIANNRISGSGSSDINDNGTGTVLDANLTGSAN